MKRGIDRGAKKLIRKIRNHSRRQANTWRKIPFAALEASARIGYDVALTRAYRDGLWAPESSKLNGSYSVYVDLETGELVDGYRLNLCLKLYSQKITSSFLIASDEDVLRLALHTNELEAKTILEEIRSLKEKPYFAPRDAREIEEIVRKTGEEFGVEVMYSRRR